MFSHTISPEELQKLPILKFEGRIRVIRTLKETDEAVMSLLRSSAIGFDTETRPSFVKGHSNGVALLQLSDENEAYLFQLKKTRIPDSLAYLLSDSTVLKIGAATKQDVAALMAVRRFEPRGFVDLQQLVKEFGIENAALAKMSGIVLGARISKAQQLSNWEADELTPAQKLYAATDAWVSLKIYQKLKDNSDGNL